jgi:excisionase family DNA binding protein
MSMNGTSESKRLAEAVANLASTITELIDLKLRQSAGSAKPGDPPPDATSVFSRAEGWVGKKETAEHLGFSQRTVDNWMKNGLIPYIKIGKVVRFKLSEVDEAINRRLKIRCR